MVFSSLFVDVVYFVENLSLCVTYNALFNCLGLGLSTGVSVCFSPVCHSLLFSNSPYQSHFQKCLEHILQKGDRPFVHVFGCMCCWSHNREEWIFHDNPYPYALMQSGHQIIRFAPSMLLSWEFKRIYSSLKACHSNIEFWFE